MTLINKFTGLRLNRLVVGLPIVMVLGMCLSLTDLARAAVTLVSFTATGMDGSILVEWETATELNSLGFFVQASDQESGAYTRISPFIESAIGGSTGSTYSYLDQDVTPGVRKYYKLESVDDNQDSELTSPVSAIPGQMTTPTSTLTPTSTSTSTPIPTETSIYSSAYPAPPSPTSPYPEIATTVPPVSAPTTAVPIQTSTSTPGGFAIQSAVPTSIPLATTVVPQNQGLPIQEGTLVPLPSISIQFIEGITGTPELSLQASMELPNEEEEASNSNRWSRYVGLSFIVMIWALLGGWFWFSIRKVE